MEGTGPEVNLVSAVYKDVDYLYFLGILHVCLTIVSYSPGDHQQRGGSVKEGIVARYPVQQLDFINDTMAVEYYVQVQVWRIKG